MNGYLVTIQPISCRRVSSIVQAPLPQWCLESLNNQEKQINSLKETKNAREHIRFRIAPTCSLKPPAEILAFELLWHSKALRDVELIFGSEIALNMREIQKVRVAFPLV